MGKESALYLPSGSMANTAALLTHCRRGDAIIVGHKAHIFEYEVGGASRLNGSPYMVVKNLPDGTLDPQELSQAFIGADIHEARVGLLCIENTQNMCGGQVLSVEIMRAYAELAHERQIPMHVDGARLFNAAIALAVPASTLVADADSVMFCLSKGLCAPVGSMLAGSQPFIEEARRVRKLLGGGMRQAGIIAAAGIVALNEMVDRLAEDHAHAQLLATQLANMPGIIAYPEDVKTNIVFFKVDPHNSSGVTAQALVQTLSNQGIQVSDFPDGRIRALTHYGITEEDIQHAATMIAHAL
jgi:threonine aldolase